MRARIFAPFLAPGQPKPCRNRAAAMLLRPLGAAHSEGLFAIDAETDSAGSTSINLLACGLSLRFTREAIDPSVDGNNPSQSAGGNNASMGDGTRGRKSRVASMEQLRIPRPPGAVLPRPEVEPLLQGEAGALYKGRRLQPRPELRRPR